MTGRQRKHGNQFPHSKKLVQEPEGNEENRYSDPDSNKMKINYAKEPNEAHKNHLKEEILQVFNENFIEMKFQDNKNREFEKAQDEIKETIEVLYKHQSETKNMINKEINEPRTKIDIKDEETQDMETSEKRTKQNCKTKWKANPAE
jgi:hypothetical protein